ncbi:uncharacterized protein [Lolium perenne]|uniref:uncharacterized protein n=1 Tax=Lolium perenne TaxID=4522 RepID=UPI003A999D89
MGLGRCGEARLPCVWGKEVQVIADSSLPAHFISTRQHDQQRRAAAAEAVRGPKLLAEPCHRRCSARAPQLPASTRRRSIDGGRRPDQLKYFNDTGDLMDIQMNNVWNQLIQFELL